MLGGPGCYLTCNIFCEKHLEENLAIVIPAHAGIQRLLIILDPGLGFGILRHSTSSIPGVVRRGDKPDLDPGIHRGGKPEPEILAFAGVANQNRKSWPSPE